MMDGTFFSQVDRERKKKFNKDETPPESELSEEIFSANLQYIRKVFKDADVDGNGALDLGEFVGAFKNFLGKEREENELIRLFNRIDADANNEVDWVEFYSYLFLEKEGKRRMVEDFRNKEFIFMNRKDVNSRYHLHHDMIQRILHDPEHEYIITSTNSTVKLWNEHTFEFVKTLYESKYPITDIHIHSSDLFISDLGRTIIRIDLSNLQVKRTYKGKRKNFVFRIPHTPQARIGYKRKLTPTNKSSNRSSNNNLSKRQSSTSTMMPSHLGGRPGMRDTNKRPVILETLQEDPMVIRVYTVPQTRNLLVIGSDDGLVKLYDLSSLEEMIEKLRIKRRHLSSTAGLPTLTTFYGASHMEEGEDDPPPTVRPFGVMQEKHRFGGNITGIEFLDYYRSIFVSSWDGNIKLFRLDSKLQLLRTFHSYSRKPIYSICYDPDLNLLSSCGRDKTIELFNPSIKIPIVRLTSHRTPVIRVRFNPQDNMVVSLGQNKTIKVWDTRTFKVIQTVREKRRMTPENQYTSLFFHPTKKLVICGSCKLHSYQMRINLSKFQSRVYCGTQFPVRSVLYSKCMQTVVTCDQSTIYSWDVKTGKLGFKFFLPKGEISLIAWDDTQRRIIVVQMNQKIILMMNYLNGQLLKRFDYASKKEISSLCFTVNKKFEIRNLLIGGCEQRISVFNDQEDEIREKVIKKFPRFGTDILCMICVPKEKIVSGLLNGAIVSTDLKTGKIREKVPPPNIHSQDHKLKKGSALPRKMSWRRYLKKNTKSSSSNSSSTTSRKEEWEEEEGEEQEEEDLTGGINSDQIEELVYMERQRNMFISLRGSGEISFWTTTHLKCVLSLQARPETSVMALSPCNRYLVTGDLRGFICVYDLQKVLEKSMIGNLNSNRQRKSSANNSISEEEEEDQEVQDEDTIQNHRDSEGIRRESFSSVISGGGIAGLNPRDVKRLVRFRGHQKEINSIIYVDGMDLICTGSMDCTASLFTLEGERVGYFGQERDWNIQDRDTYGRSSYYDLRKVKNIFDIIDAEEDDLEEELEEDDLEGK